jgi:hypothetical protein
MVIQLMAVCWSECELQPDMRHRRQQAEGSRNIKDQVDESDVVSPPDTHQCTAALFSAIVERLALALYLNR